jgi:hypothetical protein
VSTHAISLVPREPPLPPAGVVATGAAFDALAVATRRARDRGVELREAVADGWLVVLGNELPWAEGCVYVGRDGPVFVPTTKAVAPSADLVADAVGRPGLVVVLEDAILRGPLP